MPKNAPIPVPSGNLMLWVMQNPASAAQVVQAVNLLLATQVRFTRAGIAQLNQQATPLVSGENIMIPLPVLWSNGVPDAVPTYTAVAGGVYSQSQVQSIMDQVTALTTALNLILAGEASWQNLPGAPT